MTAPLSDARFRAGLTFGVCAILAFVITPYYATHGATMPFWLRALCSAVVISAAYSTGRFGARFVFTCLDVRRARQRKPTQ